MKKFILILSFSVLYNFLSAQNFTWMNGHNYNGPVTGVYGTQGVASSTVYPGHRHGCATWVDNSGNLWLFGGEGISASSGISWLNDLWKYNPSTNQWTWVRGSTGPNQIGNYGTQGVAANSNEPGAREFSNFWTDASGNFWLFGGDGFASTTTFGRLGDLWKYNPVSNQWTWMKGFNLVDQNGIYGTMGVANTNNLPGSRLASGTWRDNNGFIWFFGGKGFGATGTDGYLSDLWKYNISTNTWTWVHGNNSTAQFGTYGSLGTPSVTNNPGGREHSASWIDAAGNLYLFGGRGLSTGSNLGYLNDLWKYNPVNDTWVWLHGSNTPNPLGLYGTQGVSSATNVPGGRYTMGMWTDLNGNFWLFGGVGWIGTSNLANINDLWRYNVSTNEWTWMKGTNQANTAGVYGTIGVASPNNFPGARHYNNTWRNLASQLWLFGGEGIDANANNPYDNMNDLWGYVPPCNPDSVQAGISNICSGSNATLTAYNQFSASVQWYSSPTATNSIGSGSVFTSPSLSAVSSPSVYTYYAQANACTMTPRTAQNITVYPIPNISISGSSVICNGAFVTLNASGAGSYTWSNGSNASSITVNPSSTTTYSVQGSNNQFCSGSGVKTVTVNALPPVQILGPNQICEGSSALLTATGAATYTWSSGSNSNSISVSPTVTGTYQLNGTSANGCMGTGTKTITVNALPTITAVATRSAICKGETTTLTATGANTYTWSNSVVAPSIVITPTITAQSLVYTVTATNSLLCENHQTVTVKVVACENGLNESTLSSDVFNIYPNPNNGAFNIDLKMDLQNMHFYVYDALGQLVYTKEMYVGLNTVDLNVSSGIYYYRLQNDSQKTGGKIIIQP